MDITSLMLSSLLSAFLLFVMLYLQMIKRWDVFHFTTKRHFSLKNQHPAVLVGLLLVLLIATFMLQGL